MFSPLPPYIPLRKQNVKLVKDMKDAKLNIFTPLLLKKTTIYPRTTWKKTVVEVRRL